MSNRRNLFRAAWAAIAGLFCGGVASAKAPRELRFTVRADGTDEVIRSLEEVSAKLNQFAAERAAAQEQCEAATDQHVEQETYVYRGYFVSIFPLIARTDPTAVLQSERPDITEWAGFCPSLHANACGEPTREKLLAVLCEMVDDEFQWAHDENVDMPPTDLATRELTGSPPNATRVGPHVMWYWSDEEKAKEQ